MAWWNRLFQSFKARSDARNSGRIQGCAHFQFGSNQTLEHRILLSGNGLNATIALESVNAVSSQAIRVTYDILNPSQTTPVTSLFPRFDIYRSADAILDPTDSRVAQLGGLPLKTGTLVPVLPLNASTTPGMHTLDLTLPQPLPTNLAQPFVLVAASLPGPGQSEPALTSVAGFQKHSLVVYTHGALQDQPGNRLPPWVVQIGNELKQQGYEKVLTYNWVGDSWSPGRAAGDGPKLANQIRTALAGFPAGEPVDVHIIGHSEGTVINSVALRNLEKHPDPHMLGGTLQLTMLDPHPAKLGSKFPQFSTKPSFMGWVSRTGIDIYQGMAHDPPSAITQNVNIADIYYQHTYYAYAADPSWPWLNIWGEVPVPNLAPIHPTYIDITGMGISHAGNFSVVDFYRKFVIPTLGSVQPSSPGPVLTAQPSPAYTTITSTHPAIGQIPERIDAETSQTSAQFVGTTWPGGVVRLVAAPRGVKVDQPIHLGQTVANSRGVWTLNSRPLHQGTYSVVANAVVPIIPTHPRIKLTPRVRVGTITIKHP